jgi:hypothetical protein
MRSLFNAQSVYIQTLLIGAGAGLTSAVLFSSVVTQSPLALLLLFLSPLPLLIAGMGWTPYATFFGIALAGIGLSLTWGGETLIYSYLMMVALPTSILAPASTLQVQTLIRRYNSKTDENEVSQRTWWLSVGAILMVSCVVAAFITLFSAMRVGDYATYRTFVRELAENFLRFHFQLKDKEPIVMPAGLETADVVNTMVAFVPLVLGMLMAFYLSLNVWASARLLAMSSLLPRPWVSVHTLRLPRELIFALLALVFFALFSGYVGFLGKAFVGTIIAAFAIQGAVSLHVMSMRTSVRPLILIAFYLTIFMMPWVLVFVATFGALQTFISPKRRKTPPPSSTPTQIS